MIETGGWGGIAHYTWNLCQALSEAGAQVLLLTHEGYELEHLGRTFAVERPFSAKRSYVSMLRDIGRHISIFKGEVVHVQSPLSPRKDPFLSWKLRRDGSTLVMTAHNTLPHELRWGDRWTWRCLYRSADLVICHTRWSQQQLGRLHGVGERRILVIPHGNYLFFRQEPSLDPETARARLGLPVGHPVILAFGALRPYKGIGDLLQAFPEVLEAVPHARLVVAGPAGGDQHDYERLIASSGVADRIHFRPGYVPMEDVSTLFVAADVAVFPHRSIDQSGSLQIAMSFGKPVVVTAVGGFPEVVPHGKGGIVVPASDPRALAEGLIRLLCDRESRERMGGFNCKQASTTFAWSRIACQTLAAYGQIFNKQAAEVYPAIRGEL